MIPRFKPRLGWGELAAALSLPRRDDLERYEEAFARSVGQRFAVAFPYGRTGMMLLFEALGLKGREIICPAYTCVVVPHAVRYSGNMPVFADSCAQDFNMDLDCAEKRVTARTGAIVATSIFGYPADLDRLAEFSRRHPEIAVVQDCAHSFTAQWRGKPVNRAGAAAVFGCNISKIATSVFGGIVSTDDEGLAQKLRELRGQRLRPAGGARGLRRLLYLLAVYPAFSGPVYGLVNRLERGGLLDSFVKYYDPALVDMPADYLCGLSGVEARVGRVQAAKLQTLIGERRKVAAFYDSRLKDLDWLVLPPPVSGATYSHYVVLVEDREKLLDFAVRRGVQLGRLIEYCIPDMPAYRDGKIPEAEFSVARRFSRVAVNLPVTSGLKGAERVVEVLRAYAPGRERRL